MTMEMKKTKLKTDKSIYLGMSILDISKTLMYEFWYDSIKSKYQGGVKLCYMNTNSFVICITTEDCYKDIANDVVKRGFMLKNYTDCLFNNKILLKSR